MTSQTFCIQHKLIFVFTLATRRSRHFLASRFANFKVVDTHRRAYTTVMFCVQAMILKKRFIVRL